MRNSIQHLWAVLRQLPGRLLSLGPAGRARIYLLTVSLGLLVTLSAAGFQPVLWPAGLLAGLSAVSFLGLLLSFACLIPALRRHFRGLQTRLQESAGRLGRLFRHYTVQLADDYSARSFLQALPGCAVSLLFAVFNLVMGLWGRSVWYTELAAYYMLLCALRIWLQGCDLSRRRTPGREPAWGWRIYGRCGLSLVLLSLVLGGMVVLVVEKGYGKSYPGFLIYAVALWTFWKITAAVRNMHHAVKNGAPLLRALRHVNYTDAMVSLLTLQTAMFAAFSSGDGTLVFAMNSFTGFLVFLLTFLQGLHMIWKARKQSREL